MKVTCKSSIGDHWWQYSVVSWGTSAKCVIWEPGRVISNLFKGRVKQPVNTYMSSLISPIPATMIAVVETVPYTLLGSTVAMTSNF